MQYIRLLLFIVLGGVAQAHAAVPAAPSNLAGTAVSPTRVDLTWQDNSNNETGFRVLRGGAIIGTNAANDATYSDTTVAPGTTYSYKVRAYNQSGFSTSNTISVTTPNATPTPTPTPTPPPSNLNFGFSYPSFTGAAGTMTAQQFVGAFAAAMHNPDAYRAWISSGQDIRLLNPSGTYLKHLSIRTLDQAYDDHPDYNYVHNNHPEWIIRDANGNTVPLFQAGEECVDFGNPAYLDWVFGTWFPNQYFDSTDRSLLVTWYLQDNGNFQGMYSVNCGANNPTCTKYTTDAGVQAAFKMMGDKFHQYFPNRKLIISTGTLTYIAPADQLPFEEDVISHFDGFYSECITNDHCYWDGQPNSGKRNALIAELQLADWLAVNGKLFFPNLGPGDGIEPTQAQINYAYAFFNLARNGDKQHFARITKDGSGNWQPRTYPEMTKALGNPTESRVEIATNVYRRTFQSAIAYVNLSDAQYSVTLPAGTWKDSLGNTVTSPIVIGSFSGLTVYSQ